MALSKDVIQGLKSSIIEGSFPESEDFLTTPVSVKSIPTLLTAISEAKDSLSSEIEEISKERAENVDAWISQAKKVQDDIARCKLEARQIVEEHERVQALRQTAQEAKDKLQLLETEITFNQSIQHELESIAEIAQVLDEARRDLTMQQPVECVEKLVSTKASIQRIPEGPARDVLQQIDRQMRGQARTQLCEALKQSWIAVRESNTIKLQVVTDRSSPATSTYRVSAEHALHALTQIEALSAGIELVKAETEWILEGIFSKELDLYPSATRVTKEQLIVELGSSSPIVSDLLRTVQEIFGFLHSVLPQSIRKEVAEQLVPKLVSFLIANWLNAAVPYELSELETLQTLQSAVTEIETQLSSFAWPGPQELRDWIDQIPRTWLNKRRMVSLDAVRTALSKSKGHTHQVERIERQIMKTDDPVSTADEDDWNAAWDDEAADEEPKNMISNGDSNDDEPEGWDFETDDKGAGSKSDAKPTHGAENDDEGEAWGWGDDSPGEGKTLELSLNKPANREVSSAPPKEEEIVLTELYSVTDIPDHILEVIGRDISDAETLKTSQNATFFNSSAPTSALQALPTLVLAMFRATAPTYYSHSRNLSNMNLYNDALYITQKVEETTTADSRSSLQPTLDAMAKFARQTYTRELDTQRTILSDLLDGAQGFVSCNSDQYRELSASAVSAVIDRIRQVQSEYQDILGQSHLLQTIGSLISMIIGKVINDIEDLEDISEKESDRLVEYCQEISSLEDLFIATKPQDSPSSTTDATLTGHEEGSQQVSTIALYVPNYFRFQYLAEILKSSLADIKFMWTEGGLRSDFTAEEVIDLIRALFAESNHRRSAISAIKGSI